MTCSKRKLGIIFIIFIGSFLLSFIPTLCSKSFFGANSHDLLGFWSVADIFLVGKNPYDSELRALELLNIHESFTSASVFYYPPTLFFYISWFSLFEPFCFAQIWLCLSCLVFGVCCYLSCINKNINKYPICDLNWACVIYALSFSPFFLGIYVGQLFPIILIGFYSFIVLYQSEKTSHRYLSGLFLGLVLIKFHLIYLLLIYLFLHSIRAKDYLVLGGLATTAIVSLVFPLFFQPSIYQYYFLNSDSNYLIWVNPTIGFWILKTFPWLGAIAKNLPWVLSISTLFILFYFSKLKTLNLSLIYKLISFSLLTLPYSQIYDLTLLLPVGYYVLTRLIYYSRGKSFAPLTMFFLGTNIFLAFLIYNSKIEFGVLLIILHIAYLFYLDHLEKMLQVEIKDE